MGLEGWALELRAGVSRGGALRLAQSAGCLGEIPDDERTWWSPADELGSRHLAIHSGSACA
jgi:hypothetical protein